MALTDKARGKLIDYTQQLLREWGVDYDLRKRLSARTHDRRGIKKDCDLVAVRDRLIWTLWTRCWQARRRASFLMGFDNPGDKWQPLSHPNIASVLGLVPSTVTRSLQRTRDKRKEAKRLAELRKTIRIGRTWRRKWV